jgi:hypothetical protein
VSAARPGSTLPAAAPLPRVLQPPSKEADGVRHQ